MMKTYRSFFLVIPFLMMCTSCALRPLDFDEQKWSETVENTNQQALYEENKKDGRFFNPWLEREDKSFTSFLRWQFSATPEYSKEAMQNKPAVLTDLMERIAVLNPQEDFIVWIGHATFLMRLAGEYWLTDPILTDRALLPKRVTPPAIRIDDLAHLKGRLKVLISHNHYDHLDRPTLLGLPEESTVYVPAGLGQYVASLVAGDVIEMNWWDELTTSEVATLTCLPAQHWSLRIFQGYSTTLWASYMVSTPTTTIYFGGDSGYFKGYREIGKKFAHIDYALLPITAYEPRWFMHHPHMNTREAIRAFTDLGADYFIPTQWGTFHLGDNPPGLPPLDLQRDLTEMGLSSEPYLILDIGEILLIPNNKSGEK